jgi:hypothetical protein
MNATVITNATVTDATVTSLTPPQSCWFVQALPSTCVKILCYYSARFSPLIDQSFMKCQSMLADTASSTDLTCAVHVQQHCC